MTNCMYRLQYLLDGGVQLLLPKPWTSSIGGCAGIVPAHRRGHQNGQKSWSIYLLLFYLLLTWRPLGQYGASSPLMAASSGFQSSPGHAASGDAICIAPAHCHGHQNGQQRKCICSLLLPFCLTLLGAKDHVMFIKTYANL